MAKKSMSKKMMANDHGEDDMPGYAKGTAHPGFTNVAKGMAAKQGIPMDEARAELASRTRNASPAAKRKNPRLSRVLGAKG